VTYRPTDGIGDNSIPRALTFYYIDSGGLKGSEGETHIRVEGGVLLGANPRKNCNWFLNNYNAAFGLKQHQICGAKLAYVAYIFIFHLLD